MWRNISGVGRHHLRRQPGRAHDSNGHRRLGICRCRPRGRQPLRPDAAAATAALALATAAALALTAAAALAQPAGRVRPAAAVRFGRVCVQPVQ